MRLVKSLAVSAGMLLMLASNASAQNIIDNGDFATGDFTNWTPFNQFPGASVWDASNNDGRLRIIVPFATTNTLSQSFSPAEVSAGLYRLTFSVVNTLAAAGTLTISAFGTTIYTGVELATGSYSFDFNPTNLGIGFSLSETPSGSTVAGNFLAFDNFNLQHPIPEVNAATAVVPVGLMLGACLLAYDRRRKPTLVGC